MASAVTATASLAVTGIAAISSGSLSKQITLVGDSDVIQDTQDIGTSSEAITLGDITGNPEFILIKNLDATNFVSVGFNNPAVAGTETIKIKAGGFALLPTPSGTLYAIADTATVKVQKWACEA